MANKPLKSIKFPGLTDTYTIPQIDTSLTVGGKAADAQAVGNKFTEVTATAGKAFPTDTASGSVASFADGADDIPVKSCIVNIEPVQDLHGQSNPYPAGGGKNILPTMTNATESKSGVTFTRNANGSISMSGTITVSAPIIFVDFTLPAGSYTFSNIGSNTSATGANADFYVRNLDAETTLAHINYNTPADNKNFTLTETTNVRFCTVVQEGATISGTVYPMIRLSTVTDSTYAPYENICPISGFTKANIQRTGVNLFDLRKFAEVYPNNCTYDETTGELSVNTVNGFGMYFVGIPVNIPLDALNGGYIQCEIKNDTGTNFRVRVIYEDGLVAETSLNGSTDFKTCFKTLSPKKVVAIRFDWITSGTFIIKNLVITFGKTAVNYTPYNGSTYSISFSDEAGTVYGGTLDVTKGELVVDRAMVTFDGSEAWRLQSINSYGIANFNIEINHYPAENFRSLCNMLPPQTSLISSTETEGYLVHQNGSTVYIRIFSSRASTVSELMTWLASNPIQLVYALAEPIVYTLTPTEIKSLLGDNNIWADAGDTEVTYRADTNLYIEKKLGTEAPMIATDNIVSGSYFMIGNNLYKATANIASGAVVVVGTNAVAITMAEALNEINA